MEKVYVGIDVARKVLDELVRTGELNLRTGQRRAYPSVITVAEPSEDLGKCLSDALDDYCRNTKA